MAKHVVVLGGGATGEAFIGQLRRLDKDVRMTLVEQELVGGECSYWACIPSKTLLRPLEVYYRAKIAPGAAEALNGVDVARVFWWRDQTAEKDDTSQAKWVAKQGAEVVRGTGRVVGPGRLTVASKELEYDALLISTGSLPAKPPIEGLEKSGHWGSREATSASSVPKSLIIIGGGAVGCELAQFYGRIGSHVTLIQSGDYLLPRVDRDAGDLLSEKFREEGIDVRLNGRAKKVEGGHGSPYRLQLGDEELEAEALLIATGRTPNVEGFGFEELGVKVDRQGIEVDDRLGAAENVWAAGDVTGVALFTHVGKYQARIAAANVAGADRRADYRAIPAAVFTDPQIATVQVARGQGFPRSNLPPSQAAGLREALRGQEARSARRRRGRRAGGGRVDGAADARNPRRGSSRSLARHDSALPHVLRGDLFRRPRPRPVEALSGWGSYSFGARWLRTSHRV